MIVNDIEVLFGGQAGDGSLTTGDFIATAFKRMGLDVYTFKDFPSRIRGGHTNYVIRAGERPHYGLADYVDAMIAFDLECVEKHVDEMRPGGFVIFDSTSEQLTDAVRRPDVRYYEVPLAKIAKEDLGLELVRNTISLGVIAQLIGMDPAIVRGLVTKQYERKGDKVVSQNIGAIEAGENYVKEHFKDAPSGYRLQARPDVDRLIMMGNDAIGYGALAAGCRFMAGYPITPATDILEWMAKHAPKYGGVVIQAEDELAAINMIIGAAYAGARAMTATSGPGQALMTEGVGLAGVTETPIVIVECARAGPSTGMPTKTEQSNLNHLIFSGHGEIPRVVLAPGSVEESFYLTVSAFNLAEKYQVPVFIISEQALCQSKETTPKLDMAAVTVDRGKLHRNGALTFGEYKRYEFTEDGVSPRAIPGTEGGMHLVPGSEHNDMGVITEDARNRVKIMDKRMHKLVSMRPDLPKAIVHGDRSAGLVFIGYGSNRGPITEAQDRLAAAGIASRFLQLRTLWPFPEDEVRDFLKFAHHIFVVENNMTGQVERLVRYVTGPLPNMHRVLKYSGRPFRPIEIIEAVLKVVPHDNGAVPERSSVKSVEMERSNSAEMERSSLLDRAK
ncbi:MAG TPA: 2-oxoacid:acceptor oxidoreductase subunit alpha [Candidatus Eremiobacteraceae bacterium]|nr:2-oxoacid:acceptor oxidoreductase subunit alpha [Candidatus Eremiobacteraceae bacterium]